MSFEFAQQFRPSDARGDLHDLDRVALTAAVTTDDGDVMPAGSEGTIVSVYRRGEGYVIEFADPIGALATVGPSGLRLVERCAP